MATGTFEGTTSNQFIDSKIEWSTVTNVAYNSSTVTAKLYLKRTNAGYQTYGLGYFTITIGDRKFTADDKYIEVTDAAWVLAVEGTTTIYHATDGSKTISINSSGNIPDTTLNEIYCGGQVKLETIPRAATLDSLSCSTAYFTGTMTYKYTPKSSTHYIQCYIELKSGAYVAVKSIKLGKKSASQQTATVSLSDSELQTIYKNIKNDKKGYIMFTLYTYSDSEYSKQVGDEGYKEILLYIPNNSTTKPSVSVTVDPFHSLAEDFDGLYIQMKSRVSATITYSGKYGATVTARTIEIGGETFKDEDTVTSGYLTTSGTVTVKVTVTDTRGYSNTDTKTITVIPYTEPKAVAVTGESAVICARCDKDGNLSESGTYLKIKAKRSYSEVVADGVQKNFCGLRYRYKKVSAAAYSNWVTLLGAKTMTTDEVDTIQMGGALDATASYIVHVDAVDVVGHHAYVSFLIPTDSVYMHRAGSKNAIGFGKYAERENAVDSDWDFYMNEHRITGLPDPLNDTDAVPKSYAAPADIKIKKSLNSVGWYKIGTISGTTDSNGNTDNMCAVATLTIGGIFVSNQASPSMVDIATQHNQARTLLRIPSLTDNQISKIALIQEKTTIYGVYAYYNSNSANTVSIYIHTHMGAFVSESFTASSVIESDAISVVTLKE